MQAGKLTQRQLNFRDQAKAPMGPDLGCAQKIDPLNALMAMIEWLVEGCAAMFHGGLVERAARLGCRLGLEAGMGARLRRADCF